MFDLPDDDDDLFWQTLPVDEITNTALNSADGKRQAQDVEGHLETKRPRPSQSSSVHHTAMNTSPVHRQDASSRKSLQMLSDSNQFTNSENIPPTAPEQTDPHAGSVEAGSSGRHDTEVQWMAGGRAAVPSAGSATPGTPVSLVSTRISTPLPGPSSARSNPRLSTRKFPGPAGLLPQQSPSIIITDKETQSPADKPQEELPLLSSQSGDAVFQEPPWQALMADLGSDCLRVLKKFSLAAARFQASRKRLYQGKVALVMAVLESVNVQDMAASVVLRDRSGQMQGSIHKDLLKEHGSDLQPGAAIVLRQVGVLSPTSRNHYLNITPANLVALYPSREGGTACVRPQGQPLSLQAIIQAEEQHSRKSLSPSAHSSTTPRRPAGSQQHTPSSSARMQAGPQQSFSERVGLQRGQNVNTPTQNASRPMQNFSFRNAQSSRQTGSAQSGPSPSLSSSSSSAARAGGGSTGSANCGTPGRGVSQPGNTRLSNPGMGRGQVFSPSVPHTTSATASFGASPGALSISNPRHAGPSGPGPAAGTTPGSGQGGASRFRFRTPTTAPAPGPPSTPQQLISKSSTPTPTTPAAAVPPAKQVPPSSSTPTSSRGAQLHSLSSSRGGASNAATAAGSGVGRGGLVGRMAGSGDRSAGKQNMEEAASVPEALWEPWSDDLSDELLSQLSEDMF